MLDTVPSVSQNLFKFIFSQFIDENLHKFSELLKDNQNSDSGLCDSKACALDQYVVERSSSVLEDTNPSWKRTAPLLPAFDLQANAEGRRTWVRSLSSSLRDVPYEPCYLPPVLCSGHRCPSLERMFSPEFVGSTGAQDYTIVNLFLTLSFG